MRELRGGLKGFQIFIACLALGVMVIAAVGALGDALRAGFARQGETILGGDMTFARMHIRASDPLSAQRSTRLGGSAKHRLCAQWRAASMAMSRR